MEQQLRIRNQRTPLSRYQLKRKWSGWLFLLPPVLLLYLIVWRPMIMSTVWSFCDMQSFTPTGFAGLKNYSRVLGDTLFTKTLCNTLKYVCFSLVIGYLPPVVFAVLVNELVHARGFVRFSIYLPSIIPNIAVSMIWFLVFYPNSGGLLNMLLSVFNQEPVQWLQDGRYTILLIVITMTWQGFGSTVIFYMASLQGINQELYEAAAIEGAGFFARIRTITLPQLWGMMVLFFIRQIISVFQVMEQPLAMTGGGPNNASLSLALQGYKYAFVYNNIGSALALGVITFIMLLALTFLYFVLQKRFEN